MTQANQKNAIPQMSERRRRFDILTLNNIAAAGLRRLSAEHYCVASELSDPHGILLRSHNMHEMVIPPSVRAVARAGAGINNIPVTSMSRRGIPVFNTPGANANAVKELVIAGLLVAARNLCDARDYTRELTCDDEALSKAVEDGKKKFVGFELPNRTLGVVGLGAIGVEVANAALALGMNVIGFDPQITVRRAWQLSSGVRQVESLDQLLKQSDAISVHVPLVEGTRGLIGADEISTMSTGGIVINFARGEIVDEAAMNESLNSGHLARYVTDFPTRLLLSHPRVIALPHLGASTTEAEENCAVMAADNMKDYLENGNIRNSVNFPEAQMPRAYNYRITVANENVPNMVGQISTCLAGASLNIEDLLNKSQGDLAYTVVDLSKPIPEDTLQEIHNIDGVLMVRNLGQKFERL